MSDFILAQPGWAHLLWAVAAVGALLIWLEQRSASALSRFVSAPLQTLLVRRPSRLRRVTRLVALMLLGVFCTFALMRPQWGLRTISTPQSGAEIMICLDVSRSMLAEDVAPNRLERAKAELRDLLGLLDGDRLGLIAFAGRASILSPLTPDFGFLRLALDNVSANSVRRGGTRLEEPIRKAIAAFGDAGDASRSILLITDGEDHDSFPLDAARAAAERGIRILAIGFGSEGGSEIRISDPQTGARVALRDANGKAVVSRLDGSLLREMALLTDGAYIPAGTGVLDLESIYRAHIEPLTRRARSDLGQSTRTVRHDAYQLPLLLALLALLLAVLCPLRARREVPAKPGVQTGIRSAVQRHGADTAALVLFALLAAPIGLGLTLAPRALSAAGTGNAEAVAASQAAEQQTSTPAQAPGPDLENETAGADADKPSQTEPTLPDGLREAYNLGQRSLDEGDYPRAIQILSRVRERAGTDEAVRFSATYNLGWADAKQSEALLETEPEKALEHLRGAQEWFRRAIELRPANEDARYNLETVQERMLALEDMLRKQQPQDLSARLDALIEAQRAFIASVREQSREPAQDQAGPLGEQTRRANRRLAADQLSTLSQADEVNDSAAVELEGLEKGDASQQDAQQQLRAAQLEAVLKHLHTARERLAQARRQIRRNALQRGHRRAAAALDALKRSRDQLHDPVTRLDRLILDTRALTSFTAAAIRKGAPLGAESTDSSAAPPAWLSQDYLTETQQRLNDRTRELQNGLATALSEHNDGNATARQSQIASAPQQPSAHDSAAQAQLMQQLREAVPLMGEALDALEDAYKALERKDNAQALARQSQAGEKLSAAREYFLDLRQLIELVYTTEQRIWRAVSSAASADQPAARQTDEAALDLQTQNLLRSARLGPMITDEGIRIQQQNPAAAAQPGGMAASSGMPSEQTERLDQAYSLWGEAQQAMYTAQSKLRTWSEHVAATERYLMQASETQLRQAASDSIQQALVPVGELRRLFFSLIEHLKDTAQRQQELIDRTGTIEAEADNLAGRTLKRKTAPLAMAQSQLSEVSEALSGALKEQADQQAAQTHSAPQQSGTSGATTALQQTDAQPQSSPFAQAAELVEGATAHMRGAGQLLEAAGFEPEPVREAQTSALDALLQAVALIEPPDQSKDEQPGDDDEQSGQQDRQAGDQTQSSENEQQRGDMDRLLQGVRDREAQRREAQSGRRPASGYETVEKDW